MASKKATTVVDRLQTANVGLGECAKALVNGLCGQYDAAFVVIVERFHDAELSPRKIAFAAATAAALSSSGEAPDIAELALLDMVRKALANRTAELEAAKGGDRG